MSQKIERPVLQGQRIKTRKRDEKEKYDPSAFRDAILQGIGEAGNDLEAISKFLDSAGSRLDYRRYAEPLLDILFAGGILAPGGSIQEDADTAKVCRVDVCLFRASDDFEDIKTYYQVFYKLIRRYKYIEKHYQDELKKLVVFLRGFQEDERAKLAKLFGITLANGLGNATCLQPLFEDHLVKDGLAMDFATQMFSAWLRQKDISHVATTLKRAGLEYKLLHLLPINKRTQENFESHFQAAGLLEIVDFQRAKATHEVKKDLYRQVDELIKEEETVKDMVVMIKDLMKKNEIPEHEAIVIVWPAVMNHVEWNKKEELVAEQAVKHLRTYSPLLAALSSGAKSELALMNKVQDYCYDNPNFMKIFQKIIVLFYKMDVLSEDVILQWYKGGHTIKGKSIFLEQMKKFVEWLQNAEEESEEEDD